MGKGVVEKNTSKERGVRSEYLFYSFSGYISVATVEKAVSSAVGYLGCVW